MEKDELFDDAVRVVLETKRGSVSLLQRRLIVHQWIGQTAWHRRQQPDADLVVTAGRRDLRKRNIRRHRRLTAGGIVHAIVQQDMDEVAR